MKKEIEMFMTHIDAFERLDSARYDFNVCKETNEILGKYMDFENKETNVPPKVVARELMWADQNRLMDDDIFYFIDKALRDAYYQIKEPIASFELGCLYYFERYNHVDYAKAFKYFSKEKDIGESNAMLGECYFYGRGVKQDYEKAFHNLVKSALTDSSARTSYLLGDMYKSGYYVEQDILEAYDLYWHAKCIAEELKPCAHTMAEIYYRIGDGYFEREKDRDSLKMALQAFNYSEQMFLQAIYEGNPSLINRLKDVRNKQNEVKEYMDDLFVQAPTIIS